MEINSLIVATMRTFKGGSLNLPCLGIKLSNCFFEGGKARNGEEK